MKFNANSNMLILIVLLFMAYDESGYRILVEARDRMREQRLL